MISIDRKQRCIAALNLNRADLKIIKGPMRLFDTSQHTTPINVLDGASVLFEIGKTPLHAGCLALALKISVQQQ
jgi:hypothetical protein